AHPPGGPGLVDRPADLVAPQLVQQDDGEVPAVEVAPAAGAPHLDNPRITGEAVAQDDPAVLDAPGQLASPAQVAARAVCDRLDSALGQVDLAEAGHLGALDLDAEVEIEVRV